MQTGETTIAVRLGRVIYWIGVVVAAVLLLPVVTMTLKHAGILSGAPKPDDWLLVGASAVVAICVYGLGRAARYVLSGE